MRTHRSGVQSGDESRHHSLSRLQPRRRRRARASAPWRARKSSGMPRPNCRQATDLVVLPGGFSYGDYLRCGAIAAHAPIMAAVRAHAERGGLVLGICNGFQILVEFGLLPGVLMRNAQLRFICRMQHIRVERSDTTFASHYSAGPGDQGRRSPMARAIISPTPRPSRASKARAASPSAIATRMGMIVAKRPTPTARSTPSPGSIPSASMCWA